MKQRLPCCRLADLRSESRPATARRHFPITGAALAIANGVLLLLASSLLHAEGGGDALFIDKQGNVGIGTSSPAARLDVDGSIQAKEYRGDGTALGVEGSGTLKGALDRKLDKAGGTLSGDLAVDSKGAFTMPAGTSDERPMDARSGALRYNTTTQAVEVFLRGMWFGLDMTWPASSKVQAYVSKGYDQSFTVPDGVTRIFVKAWGAGGAGGVGGAGKTPIQQAWKYGSYGGGGGFSRGVVTVTPGETLTVVVGRGGLARQEKDVVSYGGGAPASATNNENYYCGGGGGRSAIVRPNGQVQLIVAGGGGGGGSTRPPGFDGKVNTGRDSTRVPALGGKGNSGGAGGGLIGEDGYSAYEGKFRFGGRGGGQDIEGAGGEGNGGFGSGFDGGSHMQSFGGGGGGGWKGGGSGGYSEKYTMGGGGGGSGHIDIKSVSHGLTIPGTQRQSPMQNDPDYVLETGIGGNVAMPGGDGLVVIRW